MDKLEEIDLLRWQNATMAVELAAARRESMGTALLAKYGKPGETTLSIAADGTIVRAAPPPEGA
jgi:hypothetical protein